MPEEDGIKKTGKGTSSRLLTWAALLFILIALYVLSVGPVFYLMGREYLPAELESVYGPIEVLSNYSQTVEKLLDWYLVKCGCVKLVIRDGTPVDRPKELK